MDPVLARLLWSALLGLVIGVVLGVLIAASGKRRQQEQRRALRASFRYALSDDDERAIEALSRAGGAAGNETQLALGSLLRRKGDLSGAIRLHERLVLSAALPGELRRAAAYELALDFRRAGMFARAAELHEALLREVPSHREALRELREISEETGDWPRAIFAQQRMESLGAARPAVRAHLHAAHARALLADGAGELAGREVALALQADPACAAAHLAKGELALSRGAGAEAIEALTRALDLRGELVGELHPLLEEAFASRDATSGLGLWLAERLRERPGDVGLRLAFARHLRARGLTAEAARCLREILVAQPELVEPRQELGRILLEAGTTEELRAELSAALAALGTPRRPFACGRCGVELVSFSFRCPRCFGWDTVAANPPAGAAPAEIGPDTRTGT